jgi:hypothetical protein
MAPTTALAASVAVAGIVLAGLAAWGLALELPDFWDPCHDWGVGGGKSGSYEVGFTPDCPTRREGSSETKAGAAIRLALVHGVTILAGAAAIVAGWRRQAVLALAAGLAMAGETVVLFLGLSIAFPVALATAVLFLVAGLRWRRAPAVMSP